MYGLRVLSGLLNFGKKIVSLVSLVVPALVPVQLSLYGIISMIQTVENGARDGALEALEVLEPKVLRARSLLKNSKT